MYSFTKRLFDISIALLGLVLLAILIVILWLARSHTNPGPIIFTQTRIGRNSRPFRMYKIRTMVVNAPEIGPVWTVQDDPRITKLGHWLRRTSLDELPQLLNVLKGDMSLVGPRPVPTAIHSAMLNTAAWHQRYLARPGMTGLAQVVCARSAPSSGSHYSGKVAALKHDLQYVTSKCWAVDIYILISTVTALWHRFVATAPAKLHPQRTT
jgi:lipopolysaccharide/colanic/teichoic acid biosynthesis glycosyltransferase